MRGTSAPESVYPYEYWATGVGFRRCCHHLRPSTSAWRMRASRLRNTSMHRKYEKMFGCRNMGDYPDKYFSMFILLKTAVFKNICCTYLSVYGTDLAHYYSSFGLSFDTLLK